MLSFLLAKQAINLAAGLRQLLVYASTPFMLILAALAFFAGEVGIDDALVKLSSREEIIEMNNGCICCTGELSARHVI